jgi:hypothetical protein
MISNTVYQGNLGLDQEHTVHSQHLRYGEGSKKRSRAANKNHVTFNENVRVRRIMTLDEYSEEECFATWFQAEEFSAIRQKIAMLVRKVERGGAQLGANKKYCIRGLEALLTERSTKKQKARMLVTRVVLFEQEKQSMRQCVDEEAIASTSIKASAESQLLALSVAHKDQKEAEKIYRSSIEPR